MVKMGFLSLVAVLCCAHLAYGELHTWKAFYTASSGLSDFPEFVSLNVLDNEVMGYFDSKTNLFQSKQSWMAEALGQQYEEQETNTLRGQASFFHANIRIVQDRFNQSEGVHTLQRMYGCQWDDENQAVDGFQQYAFDGEDFFSLDLKNMRYIATVQQSQSTANKWNSDPGQIANDKQYYKHTCIEWLKKYLQYGSSTLGRKVAPEVSLIPKGSEVACHATGFYPDSVMITWKRGTEEVQDDVDVGETLPNEDGTFQKRSVLIVSPEERKKAQYSCEVTHKSGEPLVLIFEEENNNLPAIVGGCVFAAVVIIVAVVVIVMKKKKDYNKAPQSDTSSDNSEPTKG